MDEQVGLLGEAFSTFRTLVRLLLHVCLLMDDHGGLRSETLPALRAGERFLACVGLLVAEKS